MVALNRRESVGLCRRPVFLAVPGVEVSGNKGEVAGLLRGIVTGTESAKDSIRCGSVSNQLDTIQT